MSTPWLNRRKDRGAADKAPRSLAAGLFPSLAAGLAAFLVYRATLAPTVASLDAGRFQVAASLLGTAHPTGYPTFILLGHLFTYLPFGDSAYRVNLLAAVAGAVAAALSVTLARALGAAVLPAVGAALLFAFSTTFWAQATVAEVYTLHAAFLLAVLLLLLRWRSGKSAGSLLLAALLYGLALGNNAGTVLLAPALLALLLDRRTSPKVLAGAVGAGLAGLSVYAYLPIRGFAGAWNNYGDPVRNWPEVWRLVSGARFQGLLDASPAGLYQGAGAFLGSLFGQAPWPLGFGVGLLLAAGGGAGALILLRRDRTVGVSLLLALAATLLYALSYKVADVYVYYLPPFLLLAILLAVALDDLAGGLRRTSRPRFAGAVLCVPLALAGAALVLGYGSHDRSRDYAQREKAAEVLEMLPEGAVLCGKANIFPVTYLHEVEGRRPDVALCWTTRRFMDRDLPAYLGERRPVYLIREPRSPAQPEGYPEGLEARSRPVPAGEDLVRLLPRED